MLKICASPYHKEHHYSRAAPIWPQFLDDKSIDFGRRIGDKEWEAVENNMGETWEPMATNRILILADRMGLT
jgi:hypothetical protein